MAENTTGDNQAVNTEPESVAGNVAKPSKATDEQFVPVKALQERLARAERKYKQVGAEEVFNQLGILPDEIEEVKELLNQGREGQSELKKIQRKHQQVEKENVELRQQLDNYVKLERNRQIETGLSQILDSEATAGRKPIKREQILSLLKSNVTLGDGNNLVVLENGQVAQGVDAKKYVKTFLDENPHLLQPINPTSGAGSRIAGGNANGPQKVDVGKISQAERGEMLAKLIGGK